MKVVQSGVVSSGNMISAGNTIEVESGGSLVSGTIEFGGTALIYGAASDLDVNGGGWVVAETGATLSSFSVARGGLLYAAAGSVASGSAASGGYIVAAAPATTLSGSVINSGFAVLSFTTSGGWKETDSGSVVSGIEISSAEALFVLQDGSAVSTTVFGGTDFVNGLDQNGTIAGGGEQYVYGLDQGDTITGGGEQIILGGGTALDTVLAYSGIEIVSSGGGANGTVLSFGGEEVIAAGGIASATVVSSGGIDYVLSGGSAIAATVSFGGSAIVGGAVSSLTIDSGGFALISGDATATGLDIATGGWVEVEGGADIGQAEVGSGAVLIVAGATVARGTVAPGGYAILVSGAETAISSNVISGGFVVLSATASEGWRQISGGTTTDGLALSSTNEKAIVLHGGTVRSGDLTSGATAVIYDGGAANSVTVTTDAFEIVSTGGASLATLVGMAGTEIISEGGIARQTSVVSGGSLLIESGGTATGSVVSAGVEIVIGSDGNATIGGHGYEFVLSGGSASGATLSGDAEQIIRAGGSVIDTMLASGGSELVSAGGSAHATAVDAGGQLFVSTGGQATDVTANGGVVAVKSASFVSGLTVGNGGWAAVSSGGFVTDLDVSSGGILLAFSGSTVFGNAQSGGYVIGVGGATPVVSGAIESGVVVLSSLSSGKETVFSQSIEPYSSSVASGEQAFVLQGGSLIGGVSSGAQISAGSGAEIRVYSAGTTQNLVIDGALETISRGGVASNITVTDQGAFYILSGAVASGITITNEGFAIVDGDGSAASIVVGSGGNLVVDADITSDIVAGDVTDVTVSSGGSIDVDFGGRASVVTIEDQGAAYIFGTMDGSTLTRGGYAIIESSYQSVNAETKSGGVLSGSTILGTVLVEGGSTATAGAILDDTISAGGVVLVESGGIVDSSDVVASGGTLILLSGADAITPATEDGGTVVISGVVIVEQMGTITVYSGTSANGEVISSGLSAFVLQGGGISGAIIENYGGLEVQAGGTAIGTTIAAGGTLMVDAGGAISGAVTFSGIEGAIEFASLPTSTIVVSNFGSSDNLLFDSISGGGARYSLISGHTLVVSGVVAGGSVEQTATVVLDASSSYESSSFVLSNTKTGGLEVSYADTAASGGTISPTSNATSYDIPLYVLNYGGGYKIGIEVSLDDGQTYKMYEFDTGGTGLYAVYNPSWWSSYTIVSSNPAVISYTSGNTYTAQVVSSNATFQTTSGTSVGVTSDIGLISSADDPSNFTPQSWNSNATDVTPSAPLQDYFYGDFGVGLGSAENGIDNILAQFPSGTSNGFIVTVGNESSDGTGGVGSLQVGLTSGNMAGYTTIIAMQGENALDTFANSGASSYQELLAQGMLIIDSYLAGTLEISTNFVFDTGAPSTGVRGGTTITSTYDQALSSASGVVLTAAGVPFGGTATSGWVLDETSGFPTGTTSENAIGDTTGYVNTGLDAYWGVSVMFDVADGVIGFKLIACFAEGTCIRTPDGERPVETLIIGDRVTTIDGGERPVQWIGHRAVDCGRHPAPETVQPVRIMAHAFGPGLPARDLFLSPDHALYLDGVLIPVKQLINRGSVAQIRRPHVTYYHLELAQHDVVFAEGLPAETYLETGQRSAFTNGGSVIEAHPRFAPDEADAQLLWAALGYAPLVISGPEVESARARLATPPEPYRKSA